eukprot:1872902-Alexandrium_andersonii.AAC.1
MRDRAAVRLQSQRRQPTKRNSVAQANAVAAAVRRPTSAPMALKTGIDLALAGLQEVARATAGSWLFAPQSSSA